jgi:hypothetical protein
MTGPWLGLWLLLSGGRQRPPAGNHDPRAWAVRLNDDILALNRFRQVLNLERDVRNRLDQFWIRGVVFKAHPFDAIRILPVTADVHLQMVEMNLILQRFGSWYAKVVIFHGGAQFWFLRVRKNRRHGFPHSCVNQLTMRFVTR